MVGGVSDATELADADSDVHFSSAIESARMIIFWKRKVCTGNDCLGGLFIL